MTVQDCMDRAKRAQGELVKAQAACSAAIERGDVMVARAWLEICESWERYAAERLAMAKEMIMAGERKAVES